MEAGLIASIVAFAWGLLLAATDSTGDVHTAGIVLAAVAVAGAILSVAAHVLPRTHHHHR